MALSRTNRIVQTVRDLVNEANYHHVSDDQLIRMINVAQRTIANYGAFRKEAAFDSVASTRDYDLLAITDVETLSLSGDVTELTGGMVGLPCAAHGLVEGQTITVSGTDNYDSDYVLPVQTQGSASVVVIEATYVEETLASPSAITLTTYPFSDLVAVHGLWRHGALIQMKLMESASAFRNIELANPSCSGTPQIWHVVGSVISVFPYPDLTVSDGFGVFYSYAPDDITEAGGPLTPPAFDDYYAYSAIEMFFHRDYTGPESAQKAGVWGAKAKALMYRALSCARPGSSGVRPG
jgi:hypothetical protein